MKIKTSKGRVIDMGRLAKENETLVAGGNAHMNARGDILKGGKVVQTREEVASEYHRFKKVSVKSVSINELVDSPNMTPYQAVEAATPTEPLRGPLQDEMKELEDTVGFASPADAMKAANKRQISQKD